MSPRLGARKRAGSGSPPPNNSSSDPLSSSPPTSTSSAFTHSHSHSNSSSGSHRAATLSRTRRGSITSIRTSGRDMGTGAAGSGGSSPATPTSMSSTRSRAGSASVVRTASAPSANPYSHSHSHSHSNSLARSSGSFSASRRSYDWGKRKRRDRDREEGERLLLKRLDGGSSSGSSTSSPPRSAPSSPRCASYSRWMRPRCLRSPRRVLGLVLGVILAITILMVLNDSDGGGPLAHGVEGIQWLFTGSSDSDQLCHFVSPVEAYHRDLARIRSLYPQPRSNHSQARASHAHHVFSPTGHLVMSDDPGAPHPIPQLIALGEKRWEELLARQSRTLGEAVAEYRRRYKRSPPRGFDKWWQTFAVERELVLPDEYDRINLDLAPFWALPKDEIRKRLQWVEDMPEVFILDVKKGKVKVEIKDQGGLKWKGTKPRANDIASLLRTFARYLPDLRATFSIFDQPQIYLSWARKSSLIELGLQGKHTTHLLEEDDKVVQLSRSCAPNSNLRRNPDMYEGKSFIYDTLEASDFCENPYLVPLHGLTIERHDETSHPRPHTQLLPLFSLTKTVINSDILVTPLEQFFDRVHRDPVWEKKTDSRLVWRGSPTGIAMMTKDIPWRDSHRIRLHRFANNNTEDPFEYIVPDFGQEETPEEAEQRQQREGERRGTPPLGYRKETLPRDVVLDHFFDMKLSGHPIQCDEADGTCDDMDNEIKWAPRQSSTAMYRYKYILDIDGNGWSGRFRRIMASNSLVIKTGLFTEWNQAHLIPWFMYVPAKLDFSDLPDIMSFFAGSVRHPEIAFDETAKALAQNGKCFVERMFRYDDLQAYMMRLFLEYARLTAPEDEDMDFHYDPEIHGDPAIEYPSASEEDEEEEDADVPPEEDDVPQHPPPVGAEPTHRVEHSDHDILDAAKHVAEEDHVDMPEAPGEQEPHASLGVDVSDFATPDASSESDGIMEHASTPDEDGEEHVVSFEESVDAEDDEQSATTTAVNVDADPEDDEDEDLVG